MRGQRVIEAVRAGAVTAGITPPFGTAMDGYGARQGVSTGERDPLLCRALVLDDGDTRIALAVCDLIGVGRELVAQARTGVAERCGIPPERVLISATHTHAGPAGMRGRSDPALVSITARAIAGAIIAASDRLRPAVLKVGSSTVDSVQQNLRDPTWPVDTALHVLQVDTPDARPIATAAFFALHGTVHSHRNLLLSADWPGAAARTMEYLGGGTALVFNGACANVNPVWMSQSFPEVERVGRIVGAEAAKVALELRPLGHTQQAENIRWGELTEKPVTRGALIEEPRFAGASMRLWLPLKSFRPVEQYDAEIVELAGRIDAAGSVEDRHGLAARRTRLIAERGSARRVADSGDSGGREVELQALRLAPGLTVLGLPGEWFVESAREIAARAPDGRLLTVCYANDYPGYLTPPSAYPEGGYEAGMTPFPEEAEPAAVQAAVELLQSLG